MLRIRTERTVDAHGTHRYRIQSISITEGMVPYAGKPFDYGTFNLTEAGLKLRYNTIDRQLLIPVNSEVERYEFEAQIKEAERFLSTLAWEVMFRKHERLKNWAGSVIFET